MSKAPDMSNISAVLFDKECKIKYTSFNDTQDISSTFLNIDKNALSTYIALYSYATTNESNIDGNESTTSNTKNSNSNSNNKNNNSNNHVEDSKDGEERKNPIITASLKNKRKLLLTKVKDTYFTILIKESLKYYQLELLRKGMRWVCNLISVDETIRLDTAMGFLSQMDNVFGYYHLLEDNNNNKNKHDNSINFYSKNTFVYDLDRKEVVLENNALSTNFSNDALADWVYYTFKILRDKKKKEEEANNLDMGKGGLNDNFIVNNLKLPFKFTYDVINEIVGTTENSNTSNINLYTSLSEERETQINGKEKFYPNTHFLKEKEFAIEKKNVLIWEYDSFIGILSREKENEEDDGELEYTILQEEEEKLLNLVKEYESMIFNKEERGIDNFHYIIQSLESENTIMSNMKLNFEKEKEKKIKIDQKKKKKEEPVPSLPPPLSSSMTSSWFPHLNITSWSTNNQLKKDDNNEEDSLKSTALINNLSEKEYEKLLNHLLTITSREKLSIKKAGVGELAEERLIKLKDYDLVIYITFVENKFILVVKDFPLEKPDTLTQQQNGVEKGLNNLYLLGSEATNFITSKII